ncbi:hypothetical protein SAMN05216338_105714 [Bradyrhizobium sp. Rc2d]|nr:hypothetical protein [Bradyrhizobium sp. Rc2d]SDJ62845.1 hypothetical protein SAMN05216338_105714 [Bradyrhizobium sp. Rc2d]
MPRLSATPIAIIRANALDVAGIDFEKFGITAIRVMRGQSVVAACRQP